MYKKIFSNSRVLLIGNVIRAVIQAVYFFLLAREIGSYDFGLFTLVLSVIAIFSPWDGFGLGSLYLMNRSRGNSDDSDVVSVFIWYIFSGSLLTLLAFLIKFIFFDYISNWVFAAFCLSELFFFSLSSLFILHFQAIGNFVNIAIINVTFGACRLMGLSVAIYFLNELLLSHWAITYLVSSIIAFLVSFILFTNSIQLFKTNIHTVIIRRNELKEAFHFGLSRFTAAINGELDKLLLSKMVNVDVAGIYGLAMRIVNMVNMPLLSLFNVTYPQFFFAGEKGTCSAVKFARKLVLPIIAYMLLVILLFNTLGYLIVNFLGDEYSAIDRALSVLIYYPFIRAFKTIAADILSGSGYVKERSHVQMFVLPLGAALLYILINSHGWIGACYSLILIELISFILFSVVVAHKVKFEKRR